MNLPPLPHNYPVPCETHNDLWAFTKVIDLLLSVIHAISRGDPV
jgi:hypothetical protein